MILARALLAAAWTLADPAAPGGLAKVDELHRSRDNAAALAEEQKLLAALLAQAPGDAAVLWRAARMYFWMSDDGAKSHAARSELGKKAWDLAERAVAANPREAAGYYYAAIGMGSYAIGLGAIKALSSGLEGKFRDRLERAGRLDPGFDNGGIDVAWGRFFDKLPWPKRDAKKSEQHYRRAMQINPHSLRARAYLADLYLHEDRAREAKALLDEVLRSQPGKYDIPEERRSKAIAAWLLPRVMEKLGGG